MEKEATSKRIRRIKFEDFIYRYEDTVNEILDVLGLDAAVHTKKKTKFIPEKSIFNTQLFLKDKSYKAECDYIAKELSEFLYDFPYPIDHKTGEVF